METKNILDKINWAIENVEMPENVKKLLVELKNDIPQAKSSHERQAIFLRWGQIVMTAANVITHLFK